MAVVDYLDFLSRAGIEQDLLIKNNIHYYYWTKKCLATDFRKCDEPATKFILYHYLNVLFELQRK